MESEEEYEWSFGFGSNMDPAFMESSKGLKVPSSNALPSRNAAVDLLVARTNRSRNASDQLS